MIFTELRFIALFIACWICFVAVPRSWRSSVLAVWGVAFYAMYAQWFLAVVLALTLLVFVAHRRAFSIAAGAVIVALLGYYKWRAAAADVVPSAATTVLVPLGLSYLSFELLHVIVERRQGRINPLSLPDLLAFVFFAPARIAGPIKRYPDFTAAVHNASVSSEHVYTGVVRVLFGLAKKYFIADVLRLTVSSELSYAASARQAWTIVLAFTFQIYFDFSAYTDMAIGFARMLGITLPENFRRPYLAPNIREFWNRWHITLSQWVRDYVFMPMGRMLFQMRLRSSPTIIAVICYLATFLVVGVWHGLTFAFIIWGLYHGALLALYHVVHAKMPARVATHPLYHGRVAGGLSVAATFVLVAVGWVPFMTNMENAARLLGLMFGGGR